MHWNASLSFHFAFYITQATNPRRLTAGVATVDEDIGTSGVGASVTAEVDVGALELLSITVATHGNHALPQVLGILVNEVGETGVDVAGRDAVHASEAAPLVCEGLGHVNAASLGDVVRGLFLRVVDDVAGHGSGDDERSVTLLLELGTDGLSTVGGAVKVNVDDLVPLLGSTVDNAGISSRTSAGMLLDKCSSWRRQLNFGLTWPRKHQSCHTWRRLRRRSAERPCSR